MLRYLAWACCALFACIGAASAAAPDAAQFVDPVSASGATLSPGGGYVAYIARTENGEDLVVFDLARNAAHAVRHVDDNAGDISWVAWKNDNRLLVGMSQQREQPASARRRPNADSDDGVGRVIAMDRDGGRAVELAHAVRGREFDDADLLDPLASDPRHVLIEASNRSAVYTLRADVETGRVEPVDRASGATISYMTDGAGNPVIRVDGVRDSLRVFRRAPGTQRWDIVSEARRADAASSSPDFDVVAPGPGPGQVYVLAHANHGDIALPYLYDVRTGAMSAPLMSATQVDAIAPWIDRRTHELLATCAFAERLECQARDPTLQAQMTRINAAFGDAANVTLLDRSQDKQHWLLYVDGPRQGIGFYVFDAHSGGMQLVVEAYPHLDRRQLSPVRVEHYRGRDGAQLWAYVTAQPGNGPRPMVVMPHGGPEARDFYGFEPFAQFLAARGYVVLQPNFRGGSGFGRAFAQAGHHQWGGRMQDDVTDAVHHMIAAGVADSHRICIVGASYGGYAALFGVAQTPALYKCAVSISGVSDLPQSLRFERWRGGRNSVTYQYWVSDMGDPDRDRAQLEAASPSHLAGRITAPVLLVHGDSDDNVPIFQSEIMERALAAAGHPARFIRLHDGSHYWDEWTREQRLQVFRETEAFLAQNIGAAGH